MNSNEKLISELKRARNELCSQCGRYKNAYMGACKGCHWDTEWHKPIEANNEK